MHMCFLPQGHEYITCDKISMWVQGSAWALDTVQYENGTRHLRQLQDNAFPVCHQLKSGVR